MLICGDGLYLNKGESEFPIFSSIVGLVIVLLLLVAEEFALAAASLLMVLR